MRRLLRPRTLVSRRLGALQRQIPLAIAGKVSGVHQARVASRRLRELLPALARSSRDEQVRRLRRQIREVTRALGPVRELDVALSSLADATARSPRHAGALAVVRARFEAERREAASHLDLLRDLDVDRLVEDVLALVPARPTPAASRRCAARIAGRIGVRSRALRRALDACGTLFSMDQLHQARIALKKFRYALELGEHAGGFRLAKTMRRLKGLQDGLGHIHDLHVLAGRIRNGESSDPSVHAALESVAASLDEEMRRLHGAFVAERHHFGPLLTTARRVCVQLGMPALHMSPSPATQAGGALRRRVG